VTASNFQEDLIEELRLLFKNRCFLNPAGKRVAINIYGQALPIIEDGTDVDPMPYICVRLEEGSIANSTSSQVVNTVLLIGVFDDSAENQGHKEVLNIIQKIQERFEKEPILAKRYRFQDPFDWALQDEDTYPYYFGAIHMQWQTAAIRREDQYA